MQIIESIQDMKRACREASRHLGLVPTMGALHEGHLALVRKAHVDNTTVAVTIFVNPSQFGSNEDLALYPRDLNRDLDLLNDEGVDLVFTPKSEAIYPNKFNTWVDVGEMGEKLEGLHRPGHFRGVATVVAKIFNIVGPDRAYFGQKDGQQALVIRQLVRDLNLDLEVVIVPTVRADDGLALSSRNAYLTPKQRLAAPVIYQSLCQAKEQWQNGNRDAESLRQTVRRVLDQESLIEQIDYISLSDGTTLSELEAVEGNALLLVAVKLGAFRLIDNIILE